MNPPDDKPLHDWVRQSLADYRPTDEPTDWIRVQRRLRNQRWRRGGIVLGLLFFILGIVYWLGTPTNTSMPAGEPVTSATNSLSRGAVPATVPVRVAMIRDQSVKREWHRKPKLMRLLTNVEQPKESVFVNESLLLASTPGYTAPVPVDWTSRLPGVCWNRDVPAIAEQVLSGRFGNDSTSYQALERNRFRWPDAVVVCDLTTSMYPYTTQLVSWLRQQVANARPLGLVFFTDCDSLGHQTRPGGLPGKMYIVRDPEPDAILPPLLAAAHNTIKNQDDAENDVDALIAAQQAFPQARHLILIADNLSRVKDIKRLTTVDRPVHVILCGTTGGDLTSPFQSDFEQIARQTKGSLHTLDDDLDPTANLSGETLHVGPFYYRYNARKQRFQLTSFRHRPRRWLGFLWL